MKPYLIAQREECGKRSVERLMTSLEFATPRVTSLRRIAAPLPLGALGAAGPRQPLSYAGFVARPYRAPRSRRAMASAARP
jgi:hypothetical protein